MGILFSPNFLKHWLPVLGKLSTAFILPPEILDTRGTINSFFWLVVSTYPSEKWWSSSVGIIKFPTQWEKICSKPPSRLFSMGFLMEQHVESGFNGMIQWFSRTNQLQHLRPWSSDVGASPGVTVYPQHLSCFSLCKLMISGDIFVRYTSDFAISLSGEPPQLGEAFVQQMYIYIII